MPGEPSSTATTGEVSPFVYAIVYAIVTLGVVGILLGGEQSAGPHQVTRR
jgi:hypothetical protein